FQRRDVPCVCGIRFCFGNKICSYVVLPGMTKHKKIGFLSFGHWDPHPSSGTRSAADSLLQSIELSVGAEEVGVDGAYFRVHHFARQLGSPFPLLSAVGARTS